MADGTFRFNAGSITDEHVSAQADIARSKLAQRVLGITGMELDRWRIWDARQTPLTTAGTDDLGITTGTFGTGVPYITTGDVKALGATIRRAGVIVTLPNDYEDGQTVNIRAIAGMTTTVADVSATIDFEAYLIEDDGTPGASDLVSTAATTINTIGGSAKTFALTASTLTKGAQLDVRMTVATNDAATVAAVIASVFRVELLSDLR